MELKSECAIRSRWQGRTEPTLSIICLTYNHAAFIRKTLDSFLQQETDFPFEVIVHDDASTDATAAIIAEYAARYPGIVKPDLPAAEPVQPRRTVQHAAVRPCGGSLHRLLRGRRLLDRSAQAADPGGVSSNATATTC